MADFMAAAARPGFGLETSVSVPVTKPSYNHHDVLIRSGCNGGGDPFLHRLDQSAADLIHFVKVKDRNPIREPSGSRVRLLVPSIPNL